MKLLIINKDLCMGGLERSLINFINNMKENFNIDLLLLNKEGQLLEELPSNINIYQGPTALSFNKKHTKVTKFKTFIRKFLIKLGFANIKALFKKRYFDKYVKFNFEKKYDVVINYNGFDYFQNRLALDCVDAKIKLCLIHNDVTMLNISNLVSKQFSKFDYCLGCSESCSSRLIKKYNLSNVRTLYNFQNLNNILTKSQEDIVNIKRQNYLCLGTIGRLHKQKAPFRVLKVLNKLQQKGCEFDFYWIGGGPDYNRVNKFIKKKQIKNIYLLGNQNNPYKYLRQFDLFVLGSHHEAAPMVYAEAMTLGVPVVTTNTCSAKELVGDRGWVCDNSYKGLFRQLEDILKNKKQIFDKKCNLKNYSWNNEKNKLAFMELLKSNLNNNDTNR